MDDRQIEALCNNYKYQEVIVDDEFKEVANPEIRADFAQRMVSEFIENNVKSYEVNLVREKATEEYIKNPESTMVDYRAKLEVLDGKEIGIVREDTILK